MTDNELAKMHVRHMVGGRVTSGKSEILYRFEFPERPGALLKFLLELGEKWNITMFHYRNHGAAWGRVLIGFEAQPSAAARARSLSRPHRLPLFRGNGQLRVPNVPALMPRLPLDIELDVTMRRQPNETTCGPTCLHAIYDYYQDAVPLEQVIAETPMIDNGGTYAPFLGCHALKRGYTATMYTWDLMVFDPSWFMPGAPPLADRLSQQAELKSDPRVRVASHACREFAELGGSIRFRDLTAPFLRGILRRSVPMLAGLSSTYLYRMRREFGPNDKPDDLRGEPAGHFVVLSGYHRQDRLVRVSDPYLANPVSAKCTTG